MLACEVLKAVINIGGEIGKCSAGDLAPAGTVIAEDEGEASNHNADFVVVEVGAGARAESGNALRLQGREKAGAVILADAVEEEGDLAVVLDDGLLFEELDQGSEAVSFVLFRCAVNREHGGVVGVFGFGVVRNGFVVAEREAIGIVPVG